MKIHPTAIIDPTAEIEAQVEIGPYVVIGQHSRIGQGTRIAAHAVIGDYTLIGPDCRIFSHASVGAPSQDLKHQEEQRSWLIIGARNRIREFVTLNRATQAEAITRIGDDNLLMAYAHVAHDCRVGNRVVLANGATLGGHVSIGDDTVIGAMSGIHQFVQIGRLTMIGAMSRVVQDVLPFVLAVGNPPKVHGINVVGLRRQGLKQEVRQQLKQAYQILYRRQLNLSQAVEQLRESLPSPELQELLHFIGLSQRGLVGLSHRDDEIMG